MNFWIKNPVFRKNSFQNVVCRLFSTALNVVFYVIKRSDRSTGSPDVFVVYGAVKYEARGMLMRQLMSRRLGPVSI